MALTDEINSDENAKHVRRTMLANAKQNFWNGSVAPLGYRTVVAEVRGQKQKKRLEIDPEGAETIRLIYKLYLEGDGSSGPLGTKNLVVYLNDHGYRTPTGRPFHTSFVQKILKDEVYIGTSWYNVRNSKTGRVRPRDEWIGIKVPPIISEDDFHRVQTRLALRSPKRVAPGLVNSPVLLTGLVRCGVCGGVMQRRSGKTGSYYYYRCNRRDRTGSGPECRKSTIRVSLLEEIVLTRLLRELLTPERVPAILADVAERRVAGGDEAAASLRQLKTHRAKVLKQLGRLMTALADGVVTATETFRSTVEEAEAQQQKLARLIAAKEAKLASHPRRISPDEAQAVAEKLREALATSDPQIKRRLVRSFVETVFVSDQEIAITGADPDLADVLTGSLM